MSDVTEALALVALGLLAGAYGALIGAGGGFVLVPILLVIYADDPPALITSISLAVVFFSAFSGTAAYVRQRRVDFLAGNAFALATVPGAIAGALTTALLPRRLFDGAFALVLIGLAAFLALRPSPRVVQRRGRRGEVVRTLTDAQGDTYFYSYNLVSGVGLSLFVGFISSLMGIGGGVIHVPAMIQVLRFPAHVATATSQYILTFTALTGTVVHVVSGDLAGGYDRTIPLAVGVVAGAQLGAALSRHVRGKLIVRLLGLALVAVAARLVVSAAVG